MLYLQTTSDGVLFKIFVQPRAAKNEISGLHEDALKIRLTAPPVKGAANKACLAFLSRQLKVPKSDLEIAAGHSGRRKQVLARVSDDASFDENVRRIREQLTSFL